MILLRCQCRIKLPSPICLLMTHHCMLPMATQQLTTSLNGLTIGFWMWILRKPHFWLSGRKECQQFTSQSGYVEMLYTKWTNISIWVSSTPRSPGRIMWTTSVARQRKESASSTASENEHPLWLYDQYTWHPWDLYSNMPNWPGADSQPRT